MPDGSADLTFNDDRSWFAQHPQRRYRVRRAAAEEAFLTDAFTIVRRIGSDLRLRVVVRLSAPPGDDDEATAQRLYAEAADKFPVVELIASAAT
jgi:hypothetical protein